jgi:putative membrane protein
MPNEEVAALAPARAEPDLGVMRTMMAADRTLMAWIRTSLSMFSFGYTIYKLLNEVQVLEKVAIRDSAPRNAGLLLTVAGTMALIMGIIEYGGTLRMLHRSYLFALARPSLIMSLMMAFAGMALSFGIVTRMV